MALQTNSLLQIQSLSPPLKSLTTTTTTTAFRPISAVHSPDPTSSKPSSPVTSATVSTATPKLTSPSKWAVDSWKSKKALQLPEYPDKNDRLGEAALGNAFLLQGGDCAESFKEFNANYIRDTFRVILQMGAVLMFGGQMPVIKVGRMAGQFAKPRSDPFEEKDGVKLPSYRGDNVNGDAFDLKSRTPDPQRLIRAYSQSAATLNLLRAFATGGYAAMQRVNQWNLDFTENSEQGDRYRELANQVDEALGFMAAAGLTIDHPIMTTTDFWTSHECLHLPYEQSLTRLDSTSGLYYDCSAHFLWVGERTRQLDGAHVEFLRGIANPLGIKVSDKMDPNELNKIIDILNPENKPGRITIITRMGAENMRVKLPHLIRAVRRAGQIVTWVTDPMHGNTTLAIVNMGCFLFLILFVTITTSTAYPITDENHLVMPHSLQGSGGCLGWRVGVEAHNMRDWTQVPAKCADYIGSYFRGSQYKQECKLVCDEAYNYAKSIPLPRDGRDVWIFDVDETTLSNIPYFTAQNSWTGITNETSFIEWANKGELPAIPAALKLYQKLIQLGFKIVFLTGADVGYTEIRANNLIASGFTQWEKLILKTADDATSAVVYKSNKRKELEEAGYRIRGNMGDQWSDLIGTNVGDRTFKMPNALYYVP